VCCKPNLAAPGFEQRSGSVLQSAVLNNSDRPDPDRKGLAPCNLVAERWPRKTAVVDQSHVAVALALHSRTRAEEAAACVSCTQQLASWHLKRTQQVLPPRSRAAVAPSEAHSRVRRVLEPCCCFQHSGCEPRRVGQHIRPPEPLRLPRPGTHPPSQTPFEPLSLSHGAYTCARDPYRHRPGRRA